MFFFLVPGAITLVFLNVEKLWAKFVWFFLIAATLCAPTGFNTGGVAVIVVILFFKKKIEEITGGMSP